MNSEEGNGWYNEIKSSNFSVFTKKPVMKKRFPNDCRNNQVPKMNLR